MNNLHITLRELGRYDSLSEDLAYQIKNWPTLGYAAVIAERPQLLSRQVRRHWHSHDAFQVQFFSLGELLLKPFACQMLYVTHEVNERDMNTLAGRMPLGSRIVLYKRSQRT